MVASCFFDKVQHVRLKITAYIPLIQQFQYFLEGREFKIFTNHRPLISALFCIHTHSAVEKRYINFILQFPSTIEHVSGESNVVPNFLSLIPSVCNLIVETSLNSIEFKVLSAPQWNDQEIQGLRTSQ